MPRLSADMASSFAFRSFAYFSLSAARFFFTSLSVRVSCATIAEFAAILLSVSCSLNDSDRAVGCRLFTAVAGLAGLAGSEGVVAGEATDRQKSGVSATGEKGPESAPLIWSALVSSFFTAASPKGRVTASDSDPVAVAGVAFFDPSPLCLDISSCNNSWRIIANLCCAYMWTNSCLNTYVIAILSSTSAIFSADTFPVPFAF